MSSDIPQTHPSEVASIVTRARAAQQKWASIPVAERAATLRAVGSAALASAELIGKTIHNETGKPEVEALLAEALSIADIVDYWTNHIETLLEHADIELDPLSFPGKSGRVERVPRGTVALITPWNYPVIIPMRHIVPALLCGNAVVFKPSEVTPASAKLLASLFKNVLPDDLLAVVYGGPGIGEALIDADIDAVSFTGGVASGRKVATACAQKLIPCALELGGNDAAIVLSDARVERTAQGIVWGAFTNAGQSCASIERVYVVKAIADQLIARIVAITNLLQFEKDYGPITTGAQAAIAHKQLADAIDKGAVVLAGGKPDADSTRFPPTVVRVIDEDTDLIRNETFGPILPIVVVDDEAQAIERANDTVFGLTASVWTRKVGKGRAVAKQLRAGVVTINNHGFTAALPMAPWSGIGQSGYGVTNSPFALDGYTRPRFTLTDRRSASRELWWYPYTDTLKRLALTVAKMRGGAGFFGRIAAFFTLLTLVPKRLLGK